MKSRRPAHRKLQRRAATLRDGSITCPFAPLERLCQELIGHRLFSCSHFEVDGEGRGTAARIYTSDESNYPTSGLKQIVPNRWTGIVIEKRETFVANSVAEFSDVFPDHAQIDALGLGSVVNLPVILRGDFLGTVNLLHSKAYFQPARLRALAAVEAAAQLAFLLNKQTATAVNAG